MNTNKILPAPAHQAHPYDNKVNCVNFDYFSSSGTRLLLQAPCFVFDELCYRLGNSYKAKCWMAARLEEVCPLSQDAIEGYINMMADHLLEKWIPGEGHGLSAHPRTQRIKVFQFPLDDPVSETVRHEFTQ